MSLSLDGEASAKQIQGMEEHVGSCARCLQYRESLCQVSALLYSTPMARPSGNLVGSVMQRIERLEAVPAGKVNSLASLAIVGLAALCALVATSFYLVAGAYAVTALEIPLFSAGDLVELAWKLVPVLRLLATVGWEIVVRVGDMAPGAAFPAMFSTSLVLALLWLHIFKNYRGVEVGH